jgi:hypothetical protein
MKAYGGVDVYSHIFLTLALAEGEWPSSHPGHFTSGERAPGIHWIGGWVDPRAGLDDVKKRKFSNLTGLKLRPLGNPARSQSIYRLRYPSSPFEFFHPKFGFQPSPLPSWPEGRMVKNCAERYENLTFFFPNLSFILYRVLLHFLASFCHPFWTTLFYVYDMSLF